MKFLTDDTKDLREMNEIAVSLTTCKCDAFQQFGSYMFICSCLSSENGVLKVMDIRYGSELSSTITTFYWFKLDLLLWREMLNNVNISIVLYLIGMNFM